MNALAKAGIELGENGSIFPRPKGKTGLPRRSLVSQIKRAPRFLAKKKRPRKKKRRPKPTPVFDTHIEAEFSSG